MLLPRSARAHREVRQNTPVRRARTCYDHLAGVAGVELTEEMVRRGWLAAQPAPRQAASLTYTVTPLGNAALAARGVVIPDPRRTRRKHAWGCVDWTERRPHLGGALGAAILQALLEQGVVARSGPGRAVRLLRPLGGWLDGG